MNRLDLFINETKGSKDLCDFGCSYLGKFLNANKHFNEDMFTDYVGTHNKADRDSGELQDICKSEILRLAKEFAKKHNIKSFKE